MATSFRFIGVCLVCCARCPGWPSWRLQEPSSTLGSKYFWLHGWVYEAGQTDRTICTPGRRFGHLGLACGTVVMPRNVTKEARVRISARVAKGPSPSFLRRMPDAELALSLQLDLSEEVSNSCQVSRGSPEQRHLNYF